MRIVIAPDSYKESLSAAEVATAIEAGFRRVFPTATYVRVPMADGGEGTVDAVTAATGGRSMHVPVQGPLGDTVDAVYGLTGDGTTAVLEMASASGLSLVPPDRRNPLHTSSLGTGQLIRAALDAGVRHLLIGIGGSATNDAGAGMLHALGVHLRDAQGRDIPPTGEGLGQLATMDLSDMDARLQHVRVDVACDVDNPLTGPQGASAVFGPQKGATPAMVQRLDAHLRLFADVVRRHTGIDMESLHGAGAAGGMGGTLYAVLHACLRPGVDMVAEAVGLDSLIAGADLVVTGEGRIDGQTVHGKTPVGVARVAQRYGIPVLAIGGCLGQDVDMVFEHGIAAVADTVCHPCTVAEALASGQENVRRAAHHAATLVALGLRLAQRGAS